MPRLLLLALLCLPGVAAARDLRVMSFNVRLPLASDGINAWPNRRAVFLRTLREADADVIGTQELYASQAADIVRALPRYAWFGRDRRGGSTDEHTGIFYRTDRLRLVARGDFQLSDTPDVSGSISWGHLYPRMASWGVFEDRRRRRFTLFNTHLPYRPEDAAARERGARMIADRIAATPGAVVLTGDFNTEPGTPPHALLTRTLTDVWTAAPRRKGPAETFHAFTGTPDRRIDWILTRGVRARRAWTVPAGKRPPYASDHLPVIADLAWR